MLDWQQRVVDEKKELDGKIQKLDCFISTGNTMEYSQEILLKGQLAVMSSYSVILGLRIKDFGNG